MKSALPRKNMLCTEYKFNQLYINFSSFTQYIYSEVYTMSVVYNNFPINIINEFNELLQTYLVHVLMNYRSLQRRQKRIVVFCKYNMKFKRATCVWLVISSSYSKALSLALTFMFVVDEVLCVGVTFGLHIYLFEYAFLF